MLAGFAPFLGCRGEIPLCLGSASRTLALGQREGVEITSLSGDAFLKCKRKRTQVTNSSGALTLTNASACETVFQTKTAISARVARIWALRRGNQCGLKCMRPDFLPNGVPLFVTATAPIDSDALNFGHEISYGRVQVPKVGQSHLLHSRGNTLK